MAMSLAVVGCGSLAAATRVGDPAAQQVIRDPENPQWTGATLTTTQPAQTAEIRDPENPYWAGNAMATFDNGIDDSRQRGSR
jgi:hypothetical protein